MVNKEEERRRLVALMEDFCVPPHYRDSLSRYLLDHVPTDSFLQNVLSNDLKETYAYVNFLYNCAPSLCWGSPERYKDWIAARK